MPKEKKPKINPLVSEKLSIASSERFGCTICTLFRTCKTPFLKPFVPVGWTGLLLLVGEGPGEDEDERSGRPFTGRAGRLLRDLYRTAGFNERDIALVNAVRCRPVDNATPSMSQVRACRSFVLRTIEVLRPRIIVGLGGSALRALTNHGDNNVTRNRGRLLTVPGLRVDLQGSVSAASDGGTDTPTGRMSADEVPASDDPKPGYSPVVYCTYHPAAILHGASHLAKRIVDDLQRANKPSTEYPSVGAPTGNVVAIDTEFAPDGSLLTVATANATQSLAEEGDYPGSRGVIEATSVLVGHSVAQDIEKLSTSAFPVKEEWLRGEKVRDSLLLARMADENGLKGAYELETLLRSFSNIEGWKYKTSGVTDFSTLTPELRTERCRLDAWGAFLAAKHYQKQVPNTALIEFTHRTAATLSRLTLAGAFVDLPYFQNLSDTLNGQRLRAKDILEKQALAAGVTEFIPTNDTHIRDLLYDKLGLEVLERTKVDKLPSVSAEVLRQISSGHPAVQALLDYNRADKLYSTNIVGSQALFYPCGLVDGVPVAYFPFRFNPLGAKTGRRSSSDPNSQNWNKLVRGMVRSRYPGGRIGDYDYSRLEMVLIAWVAKDDGLLHDFTVGAGYLDAARRIMGVEVKEGTDLYTGIKSIILGVDYNMQTPKMAWGLWVGPHGGNPIRFSADYQEHERITDTYRHKYLDTYPGLGRYMEAREEELLSTQQVVSAAGRVRHLPVPQGERTPGFYRMLNQAINYPIQSLASDVTGAALVKIEQELLRLHGMTYAQYVDMLTESRRKYLTNPPDSGIIKPLYNMSVCFNEVHDDLVFDLHPDYEKRDEELIIETMRDVTLLKKLVPDFDLKLKVGVKKASHWGVKE